MRRSSQVFLALSLVMAANSSLVPANTNLRSLLSLPDNGISHEHFTNLMAREGMTCGYLGRHRMIFVMDVVGNMERFRAVVAADKIENPWHYIWPENGESETYKQWEASPEERKFSLTRKDYRNSAELKGDALLRGVVREAFKDEPSDKPSEKTLIVRMSLRSMPYLGRDFRMHEGLMANVDAVYPNQPGEACKFEIYSWDSGRKTTTLSVLFISFSVKFTGP
ncbi:MAG: hypothetical protein K8R88_14540 [Armatimonadetes bacterium]|nr:hypothetical protein [Armatimonadota bacterium]